MCRGGFDGEVHDGKAERGNNHPCRAEWIFSDGFHLMVCKAFLLIREYYTGQSGRLKNIGGFQTAFRLRNENYY